MKKLLLFLLILSVCTPAFCQKEGNVWFFGGGDPTYPDSSFYKSCKLDFNNGAPDLEFIPKILPFTRSNASICDSAGNFFCLSNGENIYNKQYEIMDNGGDFYPNVDYFTGYLFNQGFMLLPFPGHPNKIVHIYGKIKSFSAPTASVGYFLRQAVIDMTANNNLGKAIAKDIVAGIDTINPGNITATRHGNGRDWWILAPHYKDKIFYRYLLDPQGIKPMGAQPIELKNLGLTQSVFSPDGNWYARFSAHGELPDSTFSTIEFYRFDRCSGLLSDFQEKTYSQNPLDGKPGGVAFSASSRFMYVSRWDTIFQYDMQAPDILASEEVVAVYDGFTGPFGNFQTPQRFFTIALAPDGKIYGCVSNYSSYYLHVINYPEEKGPACDVQQHAVKLPVYNEYSIPNNPWYGLYDLPGSACDTLGINAPVATHAPPAQAPGARLYPNPASDMVTLYYACDRPDGVLTVHDALGREVYRTPLMHDRTMFPVGSWSPGMYVARVWHEERLVAALKLVKGQ